MMTAMVMVSSEGHVMKLIATGNNVKGPAMNDAPETYVATGFEVAVKFYHGLGYAPCIHSDQPDEKVDGRVD